MFKEPINSTALTTEAANAFFENIRYGGAFFANDMSFLSTMRALYGNRLPEGQSIVIDFVSKSAIDAEFSSLSDRKIFEKVYPNVSSGHIVLVSITGQKETCKKAFDAISTEFPKISGWAELPTIRALFQKQFPVAMFYREESKQVVVYVENMSVKRLHFIQCACVAFQPWYLKIPDGLSQDDLDIVHSLRLPETDTYLTIIAKFAARYDFELEFMKKRLADFEKRNEVARQEACEREIRDLNSRIDSLMDDVESYLRQINDRNIELTGLMSKLAEAGESELLGYFTRNRSLVFEKVDRSTLTFGVRGYMMFFDDAIVKRSAKRLCEQYQCGSITAPDMERLVRAVFVDQKVKLRVCAAFTLDLNGRVNASDHYSYGEKYRTYMPNTHLENHSCLGNYQGAIAEFLRRRDYVGAIGQCEASSRSLNFGDGVVIRGFFNYLYRDDDYVRCFEMPDGQVLKPSEAIKWLKDAEEAEKKAAEEARAAKAAEKEAKSSGKKKQKEEPAHE